MYKHANGLPSRLARIAGDKRCSKELEEGPHGASHVGSGAIARSRRVHLSLGSFGLRVSHVLRVHLNSVARGGRGSRASGAYLSRVSVGESRVARCGASSSNLLCIQKRKSRAALRAHRAWQRLQGQPLQRARTALARIRARVSYFENFVTEVEGLRLAQRSIRINQTSGCARGPSRTNRVCKRNAISER